MKKHSILPLAAALFVGISCSTSKISVRKDALRSMRTIAVMPFTSGIADAKVTRECTELFRGAMVASGLKVVERERLDKVLKEKELAQTGLVENKAIETSSLLGAEGTLLGEVTAHEVKSETLMHELPADGPGKYDPQTNRGDSTYVQQGKKWYRREQRDTFQFQVVVRLVSNTDAQTVLTLQNEYPVRTFGAENATFRPANLDQFRAQVLAQMSKDIEKAVTEARE